MSQKPKDVRRKPSRVSSGGKSPKPAKKKKSQKAVKPVKANPTNQASQPFRADLDQLGELPRSPGRDRIFLVARDPHRLYCYWDVDISRHPGGLTFLRAFVDAEDSPESEHPVTFESRHYEFSALRAGARYTVELGYLRGTQWNCLARSATVATPPDRMAEPPGTTFITIPQPGEQTSSRQLAPAKLPLQHRRILEVLLGENFLSDLSSASFSSEELSSRIGLHLKELFNSGSASELLARVPGALAALSGSSENSALLPALTAAHLIGWTHETLSSFAPESSSSLGLPPEESSGAGASSLLASSWNEGPGAHFLSSWMPSLEDELSSSDRASSLSSWSSHSENLSSSGHFHEKASPLKNENFLQGRLRPGIQLTINGQPIPVDPGGFFRHSLLLDDSADSCGVIFSTTSRDETEVHRSMTRPDQNLDLVPEEL